MWDYFPERLELLSSPVGTISSILGYYILIRGKVLSQSCESTFAILGNYFSVLVAEYFPVELLARADGGNSSISTLLGQ